MKGSPRATDLFPDSGGARAGQPAAAGSTSPGHARPLIDALRATTPAAADRIRRILEGDGVIVATGQQPVLFLGPSYILYKALTAVTTARKLEQELGVPVLPVFWIAADDHDWAEVATTALVDRDGSVSRFSVEPPAGWGGRSVGPAPLPESVSGVVSEFTTHLGTSGHAEHYLSAIRDAYRPGASFSEAFGAVLRHVLAEFDLAVIDSASPEVRTAARPLIQRVLEEGQDVESAFAASTEAVSQAAYVPQIKHLPGATPVFLDTGQRRERLYSAGGRLRPGRKGVERSVDELLDLLEREPERFSPNAALRPVLESWLLPVVATVLGPGEIGYWAQLGGLFARLGVDMPRVVPRGSWKVVEPRVRRVLERTGAQASDLADGGEGVVARLVTAGRGERMQSAMERLRRGLARGFDDLDSATADELPGVRSAVGKARSRSESTLRALQKTVDGGIREREQDLVRRIRTAAQHLYPGGLPQERVVSPFSFLIRYGPVIMRALLADAGAARSGQTNSVAGDYPQK